MNNFFKQIINFFRKSNYLLYVCLILLMLSIGSKRYFSKVNNLNSVSKMVEIEINNTFYELRNIEKLNFNLAKKIKDNFKVEYVLFENDKIIAGNPGSFNFPIHNVAENKAHLIFDEQGLYVILKKSNINSTLYFYKIIYKNSLSNNKYFKKNFPWNKNIPENFSFSKVKVTPCVELHIIDSNKIYLCKSDIFNNDKNYFDFNLIFVLLFYTLFIIFIFTTISLNYYRNKSIIEAVFSIFISMIFYLLFLNVDGFFNIRQNFIFQKESFITSYFSITLFNLYLIVFWSVSIIYFFYYNFNFSKKFKGKILPIFLIVFYVITFPIFTIILLDIIYELNFSSFVEFKIDNILPLNFNYYFYIILNYFLLSSHFIFIIYFNKLFSKLKLRIIFLDIIVIVFTYILFYLQKNEYNIIYHIRWYIILWLVVYFIIRNISYKYLKFKILNNFYVLIVFFFATSYCLLYIYFINVRTIKLMENFMATRTIQLDPFFENKIQFNFQKLSTNNEFIEYLNNPKQKSVIEINELIYKQYFFIFSPYQYNFAIQNKDGFLVFKKDSFIENQWNKLNIIGNTNEYLFNENGDEYYFYKQKLNDNKQSVFYLSLNYNKVKNKQKVISNLLLDENVYNINYAIYFKNILINTNTDNIKHLEFEFLPSQKFILENNSNFYKAKERNGKITLILRSKRYNAKFFIFIYAIIIFFSIMFVIIHYFLSLTTLLSFKHLKESFKLSKYSISLKIQIILIAIILISLLILSTFSTQYFIANLNKQFNESFEKKLELAANAFNNIDSSDAINTKLENLNTEINVYNSNGEIKYSTQNYLFNIGLKSNFLNPSIRNNLNKNPENSIIDIENLGTSIYNSCYKKVSNIHGNFIFNLVDLSYKTKMNNEYNQYFMTIAIIFLFAFVISILLSFFLNSSLSNSFKKLTRQLHHLDFKDYTQRLRWDNNDEIGELVKEYNLVLDKLEISSNELANSQRNLAWKEMARQISHEVKNPLTPMKLNLQYLEKINKEDPERAAKLTTQICNNLIFQIDRLAEIATDFSYYAQINISEKTDFKYNDLIESISILYLNIENVNFSINYLNNDFYYYGNINQLSKLYINLIKNAIESIPKNKIGELNIFHSIEGERLEILFKDNGTGISQKVSSNLFKPNFTTKSTGSGLGLVICKNIVEVHGGIITFDSIENIGTDFKISLPLKHK